MNSFGEHWIGSTSIKRCLANNWKCGSGASEQEVRVKDVALGVTCPEVIKKF